MWQAFLVFTKLSKAKVRVSIFVLYIMLLTSLQLLANPIGGQDIHKVIINLELKNESLINGFKKIESASSFYFMYREEDVKNINHLNIANSSRPIADFLTLMLAHTELDFKQVDQRIWIVRKNSPEKSIQQVSIQSSQNSFDNDDLVSGIVTNNNGEPMSGVSIFLKGSSLGTSTDEDGKFRISIPPGGVLIFSFVGYETQEVPVNNQTVINIGLRQSLAKLNEVVVTALGIKREAKSLTYSTQSVSTKQLTEARELNVMNALEGKVAGLSINTSGMGLGGDVRVILRGNRSISGDSQPLYVIDGVPIRGNPSNLSLDNIASMTVLKGPNAAALYGSAAQNGAIIIETKRGQANGVNISLNNTYMVMDPVLSIPFQNVYGQGQGGVYQKNSEFAWGPKMDRHMVDNWSLDPAQAGTQYAFSPQPDNRIGVYNRGSNFSSSLFASIGGEKTQTAFSYTYTKANGILPTNKLQRHNLSLRINNKLSKKLSMDSKIDYINQEIDDQLAEGESNFNPNRQIYTMPTNIHLEDAMHYQFVESTSRLRQNYWNPSTTTGANPFWTLNNNPNKYLLERVIALTSFSYSVSDALKLTLRGSYDGANGSFEEMLYNDTYVRAPDG
ncbi:MAG TPA: carboxypeptidase-like regulatory domain-containing protein, partial [Flavisolibacter sp.]|nr:carboxypeptidase-like regulatory domain-containing protein [Flavisolibacter sp.]